MNDENDTPTMRCERALKADREYNVEHEILPSENRIIDLMLARRMELQDLYTELVRTFEPLAWKRVLSTLLYTAAHWGPEATSHARAAHGRLLDLNTQIANQAHALAALLEERVELCERSGYATGYDYHIVHHLHRAGVAEGHYTSFMKPQLEALRCEYDLKYWPAVADVVRSVGVDSESLTVRPSDPLTEAGTRSPKSSRRDYLRTLLKALKEESEGLSGRVSRAFEQLRLSDAALASAVNVVLDLDIEDLIDAPYIKRFRQSEAEQGRRRLPPTA